MTTKNLISMAKRSEKQKKVISKLGGIASGIARRQKRDIKKVLSAYIELCEEKEKSKKEVKKQKKEIKDTRLNVVMPQSLVEDIKLYAFSKRQSLNSVFNEIVEDVVNKNKGKIKSFNEMIKKFNKEF